MPAAPRPFRRLAIAAAVLPLAGTLIAAGSGVATAGTTEAACDPSTVTPDRTSITATDVVGMTVRTNPSSTVDLFAYSRPSTTYARVRTAEVGADGVARFAVRPGGNTRLYAQTRGCTADLSRDSVVLLVKPLVTMDVTRAGARSYTFRGTSVPGRTGGLLLNLYRVNADGSQVLTAQTRAASDGAWRIDRRFTGTGRFGFVVRSVPDVQNPTGQSPLRSVFIY